MKRTLFVAVAICAGLTWQINAIRAQDNIVNTAASNGSFDTLVSLLVTSGLDKAVANSKGITVFAPTDAAFKKLPKDVLKSLRQKQNREKLIAILKYHVVPNELSVARKAPSHPAKSAKTLLGRKLRFQRKGDRLFVNENSKVVLRNIKCSNGLIQVIDNVLIPPTEPDNSIVGVARKAGSFKTLLAAAKAAGLAEALAGKGPFTVFAPTDEAFAKLPKGTIKSLLKPENRDQLANILKYHVVSGKKITAAQAVAAGKTGTLLGSNQKLNISIDNGRLRINKSTVIKNDISADNGVIHVIDRVLIPASKSRHTSRSSKKSHSTRAPRKRSSAGKKEITITAGWNKNISREGIRADVINIKCSAGGRVDLTNVKAKKIVTSVSGGGRVSINGSADTHDARISGGARLDASKLVTADTRIIVGGGGRASVNAKELLDYSVSAGGDLSFVKTKARLKKSSSKYSRVRTIDAHH